MPLHLSSIFGCKDINNLFDYKTLKKKSMNLIFFYQPKPPHLIINPRISIFFKNLTALPRLACGFWNHFLALALSTATP